MSIGTLIFSFTAISFINWATIASEFTSRVNGLTYRSGGMSLAHSIVVLIIVSTLELWLQDRGTSVHVYATHPGAHHNAKGAGDGRVRVLCIRRASASLAPLQFAQIAMISFTSETLQDGSISRDNFASELRNNRGGSQKTGIDASEVVSCRVLQVGWITARSY